MKKMMIVLTTIVAVSLMVGYVDLTAYASDYDDYAQRWLEKKQKEYEKTMDALEADGNLTQEAIDALGGGNSDRKPNNTSRSKRESSSNSNSYNSGYGSYSGQGKGWVYSSDELHVVGLPEGENGYTLPGWYGDVD